MSATAVSISDDAKYSETVPVSVATTSDENSEFLGSINQYLRLSPERMSCVCSMVLRGVIDAEKLLQSVKVSKNLTIVCSDNYLDDTGAAAIAEAAKQSSSLTSLILVNNKIRSAGAASIAAAISLSSTLTSVNLDSNDIGDGGAASIAMAIKQNKNFTTLNLNWNRVADSGAIAIATAIKGSKSLSSVLLNCNRIGDAGASALSLGIRQSKSLTHLDLGGNCIGNEGAEALGSALALSGISHLNFMCNQNCTQLMPIVGGVKQIKQLVSLDLSCNSINKNISAVADAIEQHSKTLSQLNLTNSEIDSDDVSALFAAFTVNNLTELNLSSNRFSSSISSSEASFHKLLDLNLGCSNITDDAALGLSEVISQAVNLTRLDLSRNELLVEGAVTIALALNSALTHLFLDGNHIGGRGAAAVARFIRGGDKIAVVSLQSCGIGNKGVKAIASSLEHCSSLTDLNIADNISENEEEALFVSMPELAKALKSNKSLRKLDMASNGIRSEGAHELANAIKQRGCGGLTDLNLDSNEIENDGAGDILAAIAASGDFISFNLRFNSLDDQMCLPLADAIRQNKRLASVTVGWMKMSNEGLGLILNAIKANHSVCVLNVSSCNIDTTGATNIAEMIQTSKQRWTHMDLSRNEIGNPGAIAIVNALKQSENFMTVNLAENRLTDVEIPQMFQSIYDGCDRPPRI